MGKKKNFPYLFLIYYDVIFFIFLKTKITTNCNYSGGPFFPWSILICPPMGGATDRNTQFLADCWIQELVLPLPCRIVSRVYKDDISRMEGRYKTCNILMWVRTLLRFSVVCLNRSHSRTYCNFLFIINCCFLLCKSFVIQSTLKWHISIKMLHNNL